MDLAAFADVDVVLAFDQIGEKVEHCHVIC